jgi:hypothetical protein
LDIQAPDAGHLAAALATMVSQYEVDLAAARRCHSLHQRGFLSLPGKVRWRAMAASPYDASHR